MPPCVDDSRESELSDAVGHLLKRHGELYGLKLGKGAGHREAQERCEEAVSESVHTL